MRIFLLLGIYYFSLASRSCRPYWRSHDDWYMPFNDVAAGCSVAHSRAGQIAALTGNETGKKSPLAVEMCVSSII